MYCRHFLIFFPFYQSLITVCFSIIFCGRLMRAPLRCWFFVCLFSFIHILPLLFIFLSVWLGKVWHCWNSTFYMRVNGYRCAQCRFCKLIVIDKNTQTYIFEYERTHKHTRAYIACTLWDNASYFLCQFLLYRFNWLFCCRRRRRRRRRHHRHCCWFFSLTFLFLHFASLCILYR